MDIFDVLNGHERSAVEAELDRAKQEVAEATGHPMGWLEGDAGKRHRIIFNRVPDARELWAEAPAGAKAGHAEHVLLTIDEVETGLKHMETDAQGRLRRPKVKVEVTG